MFISRCVEYSRNLGDYIMGKGSLEENKWWYDIERDFRERTCQPGGVIWLLVRSRKGRPHIDENFFEKHIQLGLTRLSRTVVDRKHVCVHISYTTRD